MTLRSDNFNRADSSTSLGTSSGGQSWTTTAGVLGISSNQCYAPTAGANFATMDTGVSDSTIQVTVAGGASTSRCGISFRAAASSHANNWRFQRHSSGTQVQLLKVEGNAVTGTTSAAATVTTGTVLKVVTNGSSIKCYVDATNVISVTDTTHQTNTWCGVIIVENDGKLDDWSVSAIEAENVAVTATANAPSVAVGPSAQNVSAPVTTNQATTTTGQAPAQTTTQTATTNAPVGSVGAKAQLIG